MKKLMVALCAVALLAMSACKKESPTVDNPSGGNGNGNGQPEQPEQPEQIDGEGIFCPAQKIETIAVDGQTNETWMWVSDKLTAIYQHTADGNMVEYSTFEYNGQRVTSMMSAMENVPYDVFYSYSGDKLSRVRAYSGMIQVVNIDFGHEGTDGNINHLDINVNNALIGWFAQFLGGGWPLQVVKDGAQKFSIDTTTFAADLTWQGDNVAQMVVAGTVAGSVTLGEIRQIIDIDSLAGLYAGVVAALSDDLELPFQVVMNDTMSYSYDGRHNPYHGFLGQLDPTALSASNVTTVSNNRGANITIMVPVPYLGDVPFTIPFPTASATRSYTYTYNSAGYPVTVTDDQGNVTQYSYLQQ